MKKRDILTPIGLVLCFGLVIWGMATGGSSLKVFWDLASVFITIGGSLTAMLITYPIDEFKRLFVVIVQTFKDNGMSNIDVIQNFVDLSRKARREGLLSLEDAINNLTDDYMKKGLRMVVDGIEPETIRDIMELEIDEMEKRHKSGADMLKTWGGYSPAFGMIGTLIGLIQMLANLTDSSTIASGMGKALITTFYGSVMANMVFNPMGANLMFKSGVEATTREMVLEGVLAIQSGVNPRIMEEKLVSYLSPTERLAYSKVQVSGEGVAQNG
ncbi:motility protein A [Clostridium botulinum]|uniref:Motility protein A n=2 Tax=Clostridium botulinum TaxID=1491 RepID=A0A846HZ38_CLOBO|nr:motility protein A [Clostridium botulinum]AJD28245.1 motility protein A [Clostridium botulinum CDC_297]EPS52497.1 chemotaxis MotA protein [Clostridium botulinum A1 str. CFSAN002368]ACQ52282.1 chemotaxis protein MotA [Clostridium botulinum Ba4 str. 657]AJE10836.1 motility protein A [Clostridium botulinum CDC_1436]APQ99034.1 motA/TolQ/ExbB proton channel family protein [Clostridium botulinum]